MKKCDSWHASLPYPNENKKKKKNELKKEENREGPIMTTVL
jgi:hypothetical protein